MNKTRMFHPSEPRAVALVETMQQLERVKQAPAVYINRAVMKAVLTLKALRHDVCADVSPDIAVFISASPWASPRRRASAEPQR